MAVAPDNDPVAIAFRRIDGDLAAAGEALAPLPETVRSTFGEVVAQIPAMQQATAASLSKIRRALDDTTFNEEHRASVIQEAQSEALTAIEAARAKASERAHALDEQLVALARPRFAADSAARAMVREELQSVFERVKPEDRASVAISQAQLREEAAAELLGSFGRSILGDPNTGKLPPHIETALLAASVQGPLQDRERAAAYRALRQLRGDGRYAPGEANAGAASVADRLRALTGGAAGLLGSRVRGGR